MVTVKIELAACYYAKSGNVSLTVHKGTSKFTLNDCLYVSRKKCQIFHYPIHYLKLGRHRVLTDARVRAYSHTYMHTQLHQKLI